MRSIRPMVAVLAMALVMIQAPAGAAVNYRQPVWFTWNKLVIDVLVVPPNHGQLVNANGVLNGTDPAEANPLTTSYLRAITNSIKDWNRAIKAYGSTDLKQKLKINLRVLGIDEVTADDLRNWEVLVFTDETQGVFLGTAYHVAGGKCLVRNSKLLVTSMSYEDMFNINAQEYGHCLGLSHVNEASPPNPDNDDITYDPMNGAYPHSPGGANTPLHCISNLNVKGLEEVFDAALGRGQGSANGVIAGTSYAQTSCS